MKKQWTMAAVVTVLVGAFGLNPDLIELQRVVEKGGAQSAKVELRCGAGDLRVADGAENLMDAHFEYRPKELEPQVNYYVAQGKGYLTVIQPPCSLPLRPRSLWDVKLTNAIPLDLSTDGSSGGVNLDLAGLDLAGLSVLHASGDVTAALAGDYPNLKRVQGNVTSGKYVTTLAGSYPVLEAVGVDGTSGRAELTMAGDYPALLLIDSRITSGTFDYDLGGSFPQLLKVVLVLTSGNGNLNLTGEYGSPLKLTVQNTSGTLDLDLSGKWRAGFEGDVNCTSGKTTVKLPGDVGVRVEVEKSSGLVKADGLKKHGKVYTNELWGKSPVNFVLRAEFSSGTLELSAPEPPAPPASPETGSGEN